MSAKTDFIQNYIAKCDSITNHSEAEKFLKEVVSVFFKEIAGLTDGLDSYDSMHLYDDKPQQYNYLGDVKLIKQKLCYYKATLEDSENETDKKSKGITITNTNNNSNNNSNSISINLESTLSAIEKLNELDNDQKAIITGYLTKLERAKNDKGKFWETCKKICSWLGDKSIEVGIAVLPYLGQIKQLIGT